MQEECRQAVKELRDVAFGLVLLYTPGVAQLHPNTQQGSPSLDKWPGPGNGAQGSKGARGAAG